MIDFDLDARLKATEEDWVKWDYVMTPALTLDALGRELRAELSFEDRLALGRQLWASGEGRSRILAAKLLTQQRIADEEQVWVLIQDWLLEAEDFAQIEALSRAGERRVDTDLTRLDPMLETLAELPISLQAAVFLMGRGSAKRKFATEGDLALRSKLLAAAEALAGSRDLPVQRAVAAWLKDLGPRAPEAVTAFLLAHGQKLVPWARKEAQGKIAL